MRTEEVSINSLNSSIFYVTKGANRTQETLFRAAEAYADAYAYICSS